MKSMKIMLSALLLSLSVGAYAQDEDELLEAAEEETAEVSIPANPTERRFFQRVQLGYTGTSAKYTNKSATWALPMYEKYFLSGVSLGWIGDLRLNQKKPFYLELGATFTYHTGTYDGNDNSQSSVRYKWHSRVNAFSITIPVNISYQFRDVLKEGLTLAPYVGVYGRFNVLADRGVRMTHEGYNVITGETTYTQTDPYEIRSLMKDHNKNNDGWMNGRTHQGKLFQVGAQVGVNAFYKRYSFGLAYMHDLVPFAQHDSPSGLYNEPKSGGGITGVTCKAGSGCDMEISTAHNFAVTVGYIF
jgi:hypothetical protein